METDAAIYEAIKEDQGITFSTLEKLDIATPTWATMLFLYIREEKPTIDVSFFEDAKDFFLWYSKVLILQGDAVRYAAFARDESGWQPFSPPTLIGVNLKTKLR